LKVFHPPIDSSTLTYQRLDSQQYLQNLICATFTAIRVQRNEFFKGYANISLAYV
jgi:hypothetical protein